MNEKVQVEGELASTRELTYGIRWDVGIEDF